MKWGSGGCALHQPSSPLMPFKPSGRCQPNLTDGKVLQGKIRARSEIHSSYLLCLPAGSQPVCVGWAEHWGGSEGWDGELLSLNKLLLPLEEGFSWETWFFFYAMEAVIVHAELRKELKLARLRKSFQKFTVVKALWFISVDAASTYIIL